ncbi:MAG: response regulator transcription factor [Rhizonema sp. PD38]|nr:response regulator transcription factor [Rhizonema sp. PD38]
MIRVLVIATNPVVRAGLSAVLTTNPKLTVLTTSASDLDALTGEVLQLQPDVVLLVSIPHRDSDYHPIDVLRQLTDMSQDASVAVIVFTDIDSIDLEVYLNSGVRGILTQASTELEILAAVEAVASGLVVLHPDVVESLLPLKESSLREAMANPVQALTPREIEVLQMLGFGLGNKAIAKRLSISEHTVKFHVSSIFQKLSVSTRTEAVTVGVRLGLLML